MGYFLVVVPVNIAGGGHLAPWDVGMPRLGFGRQASRGFGNDLKATCNGVKRPRIREETLVVEPLGKGIRKVDVE
jgi:hypothetical protein